MKEMFKVGPIGSSNSYDTSWDEKGWTRITQIHVTCSKSHINSIQFVYFHNGSEVLSEKHGSSGGQCHEMIKLNHDEYVTGLSGIYLPWEYKITSLKFYTNQRKYGPICCESSCLSYTIHKEYKRKIDVKISDRSEFGGLFGSFCGSGYLRAIGMYVCPVTRNYEAVSQSASDEQLTFYQSATPIIAESTSDHQHTLDQSWDDPSATSTDNLRLDYQTMKIADGYPVMCSSHKPKLKDKIKAIWNLLKNLLD